MNRKTHHEFIRGGKVVRNTAPVIPMKLNFFSNESPTRGREIEQRMSAIVAEIEAKGEAITDEELAGYETEFDRLKTERGALQGRAAKRTALLGSIAGEGGGGDNVLSRYFNKGQDGGGAGGDEDDSDPYSTMKYRKAFMNLVTRGTPMPVEYRSEVTHTTDVESVIPTPMLNTIIQKIESLGMILPLVTRTAHRGGLAIPTSSVKPVATWVAEGAGSPTQKKTTGQINFVYHKLRCAISMTIEVSTMAIAAFEAQFATDVSEAMVKGLEYAIINGDGDGKPTGILAETPAAGQSFDVQAPSYQDLVEADAAVPAAYESNIRWCMSKKTFNTYFGLVDSVGQPIGRVNYGITNKPERLLLGVPVVLCDYLPSYSDNLEAGTPFAFLFNFRDYILNTNLNMTVKRRENFETDDQEMKAVMLVDGKVVDVNSLVVLKKA